MAALQDLGGLGTEEGPRVAYAWVPVSVWPHLLPWLALLGLLALKPNRARGAWWIWLALLCGFGLQSLLISTASFLPSAPREIFADTLTALNFGMAGAWLFAGFLGWRHRFVTFLALFLLMLGLAMGTYVIAQTGGEGAIVVLMCAFIITAALSLAGLFTRKRYSTWRLLVWCVVMVMVMTSLVMAPFFIFAMLTNPGMSVSREFLEALALLVGINLGTLLVYLALAFATSFYRERLKALLHLGTRDLPAVLAPAPALETAGARQD